MARAPSSDLLLGQWDPPARGVVTSLPAHSLPPDAVPDAHNFFYRDAQGRPRPGLRRAPNTRVDQTTGTPTGAYHTHDFDGRPWVVVGTTIGLLAWQGSTWRRVSGPVGQSGNAPAFAGSLHGSLDHPARFTILQIGTKVYVLHTNGVDPPMRWDHVAPLFVPMAGNPVGPDNDPGPAKPCPFFVDWATVADRVVGILPPYDVRWGQDVSDDPDNLGALSKWPELNYKAMAETPDPLVTIHPLGTLGAAIYKTDSIWTMFPGGTTDASFFRFEFRGFYDGPACPAAVIDASGMHYFMTPTGRIGMFNGSQLAWVADGVWPLIRAQIEPNFVRRMVGGYDPLFAEVWWFFCRRQDTDGYPRGLVILSLPRPQVGRDVLGAWPGALAPLAQMDVGPATVVTQLPVVFPVVLGVTSTAGFADAGSLTFASGLTVTYAGRTATQFTSLQGYDPTKVSVGMTVSQTTRLPLAVTAAVTYRMQDRIPRLSFLPASSGSLLLNLTSEEAGCGPDGRPFGEGMDLNAPFPWDMQTGIRPTPGMTPHRLHAVETFFRRNAGNGSCLYQPVTSYDLSVPLGNRGEPIPIDLETRAVRPLTGLDARGRFVGHRFSYVPASATETPPLVRYLGVLGYGGALE